MGLRTFFRSIVATVLSPSKDHRRTFMLGCKSLEPSIKGAAKEPLNLRLFPLARPTPKRVDRAVQLVRTVAVQQKAEEDQAVGSAKVGKANGKANGKAPGAAGNDERASAIGTLDSLDTESGLFGDVQIEFVQGTRVVIVRGGKRDVQRVLEVIEQIKKQSEGTQRKSKSSC